MALRMSDPAGVMSIYSSILDHDRNWLLLYYINDSYDEMGMYSFGSQGLEELKIKLSSQDRVLIGFYREEVDLDPGFIIITYIPPSVSGVRRARALVHSRRVGVIFNKHQAILTVDTLSLITVEAIHQAILNPDTTSPSSPKAFASQFADTTKPLPEPHNFTPSPTDLSSFRPVPIPLKVREKPVYPEGMVQRSFTTTYAPDSYAHHVPPVPILPKGSNRFANFLRRKRNATVDDVQGLPPPTPPKDMHMYRGQPMMLSHSSPLPSTTGHVLHRQRSRSMSDFAHISHASTEDYPEQVSIQHDEPSRVYTLPLKGKWAHEAAQLGDPAERARRRRELQLEREREEKEALEEEAERQRRIKLEKEALYRQEAQDDARRKAETEQEIRQITAERRRRDQIEQEEEERRHRELEERKKLDRERRLEEHRRLEEWRNEQAKKERVAAQQAAQAKEREETERNIKIQQAEAKLKRTKGDTELAGWITVQNKDALSWKRRFYKFVGNTVFLYRSPKDATMPLEYIELRGTVRGLREWNEGYDFLEAIPFSFVVEFKGRVPWSMFADSEEEKYKILGLFKVAAGL